jgi:hypothetical protein
MYKRQEAIMKQLMFLILVVIAASCAAPKDSTKSVVLKAENDSTQKDTTEVVALDPGFESWYAMHDNKANYRSKQYYHNWNVRYVREWNLKASTYPHAQLFNGQINYDFSEDYPLEVEHKLFMYFQFVEHKLGIPILTGGSRPQPVF